MLPVSQLVDEWVLVLASRRSLLYAIRARGEQVRVGSDEL
jgi:hypothetical protein